MSAKGQAAHFDVAVVGLGVMGAAAAYHLARRGARVVGFDRLRPPHTMGSSHGRSRIIREAYFEHPLYVPLVQRAYGLWDALEREAGEPLLVQTGGLMCGPPGSALIEGTLRSVREHDLSHELLDAPAIRRRFPVFAPQDDWVGILEPRAGVLAPERCVAALLERARAAGADLRFDTPVTNLSALGARQVVVAAGAWLPTVLPDLPVQLQIERQMQHWFASDRACGPADCPIAIWEWAPGRMIYTFPDMGDGVKVGVHHEGESTTAAAVRRTISAAEDQFVREVLARVMPGASGRLLESRVCLYTNTHDQHFVIDRWHDALVVSPCSGHGFKFAPAIGEIVADLVLDGGTRFDLSVFSLRR